MIRLGLWLQGSQVVAGGLTMLMWAALARVASPSDLGALHLASVVGGFLYLLSAPGLNQLGIAGIPLRRPLGSPRVQTRLRLGLLAISGSLLIVLAPLIFPEGLILVGLAAALGVALRRHAPEWYAIGHGHGFTTLLMRISFPALVLLWIGVSSATTAQALAMAFLVAGLLPAATGTIWALGHEDGQCGVSMSFRTAHALIMPAASVAVGEFGAQALVTADIFVVEAFLGLSTVAEYGNAYRIVTAVGGLGVAVRYALLRQLGQMEPDEAVAAADRVARQAFIVGTVAAIALAVTSKISVNLVYGSGYEQSSAILSQLVWLLPYDVAGGALTTALLRADRTRPYGMIFSGWAIANLGLNIVLVYLLGVTGAVLSSVLCVAGVYISARVILLRHRHQSNISAWSPMLALPVVGLVASWQLL